MIVLCPPEQSYTCSNRSLLHHSALASLTTEHGLHVPVRLALQAIHICASAFDIDNQQPKEHAIIDDCALLTHYDFMRRTQK
ncbi:hypothetical protein PRIPAC_97271 [Pristionchus pacificus]|uniref:Uncharacterized protein n=1 Tax=Pristionchus pacificus TaxID=54126 RepID=A0A2A6B3A3_PRIPA|nr:hypothetical protein PRIPAC_97271 [Pristionchus pacificus]|eukprot:PDM60348.1 hypothetical protein PRIPAC_54173 [Pristionchus pacificus]